MFKKLTFFLILPILLLSLFPTKVFAKVISMERGAIEVGKDEVINDDLFAGGELVQIDGIVNGDVYAAGETVRVNGTINGDLHVGAGMVNITGTVRDDVYIGAGNVNITKAKIGDSVLIGSGNVNIDTDTSIGGSLITGAGNLTVYSTIARNLMVGAGTVDLNATVGKEASIGAGEINVGPETKIGGDLNYGVEEESHLRVSQTASIGGQTRRLEGKYAGERVAENAKRGARGVFAGLDLTAKVISLLSALLVGYLLTLYFPKALSATADNLTNSFAKSTGVGFLITLFIIPALFILAVTVIGLPLAVILFLFFLINLYMAKFPVALYSGILLVKRFNWKNYSLFKTLLVGLITLYILKLIPIIGFFVSVVILWAGLGSLFLYYKNLLTEKHKK